MIVTLATFPVPLGAQSTADQPQAGIPGNSAQRSPASVDADRLREAEITLRRDVAAQPLSADARYRLAYALLRENKAPDSLAEYTAAARLRTPSAEDLKHVAMDYVLLTSYPDADRWIRRSVAADPGDADAWYVFGRIQYERKRYGDAAEAFDRVLALAPKSVKAENNLGLAYEGLNRMDDAVAAYRQAVAWQSGSAHPSEQPMLNLGVVLVHQDKLDQALPLLVQASTIAPGDPTIHQRLGQLYLKQDRPVDAQREFQAALAIAPETAALHFLLGQTYRRQGMANQAKAELQRAAELSGTHSTPN